MEVKLTATVDGIEYNIVRSNTCKGCVFSNTLTPVCDNPNNLCSYFDFIYTKKCSNFKPLDPVLVRDKEEDIWQASFVSYEYDGSYYTVDNVEHNFIIPLNEETKYLWNTKEEAPDKYKWW